MQKPIRAIFASASILALSMFALAPAAAAQVQPPETVDADEPQDEPVLVEADEIVTAEEPATEHAEHADHENHDATPVSNVQPSASGGGAGGGAPEGSTPETAPLGSSGLGGTGGNGKPVQDPDKPG
jgi:hypothetical protein